MAFGGMVDLIDAAVSKSHHVASSKFWCSFFCHFASEMIASMVFGGIVNLIALAGSKSHHVASSKL